MLDRFKKLLMKLKAEEPIRATEIHNLEIVERIKDLVNFEELNSLLNDPVNKLKIISVYSRDFDELIANIISRKLNRDISAVNFNHYFKYTTNISTSLSRIVRLLEENKISKLIEHDLYEVISTLEELRNNYV